MATATARVQQIGESIAVILPIEVVERLGIGEGDLVHVSDTEAGFEVTPMDETTSRQVATARRLMKKHEAALRELAK